MKSLDQIKNEYALSKKCSSWENFCFVANDNMFIRAVDEIATIYAEQKVRLILAPPVIITEDMPMERFG